jgi:CBS domain-containing protein
VAEAAETVNDAARRMAERRVGSLVIVDGEKRPVGVVTDRDLVVRVLAARRDPGATPIVAVMTEAPAVVTADTSIEAALERMRAAGTRRLPVVDADGGLVGILSLDDVLALLAEELVEVGALLDKQSP